MKTLTLIVSLSLALFLASDVFAQKGPEYDQGIKYYVSGNYKEAVRIFKDYIKKKPDAEAYYRIGYSLYELKQYSEANEYFRQAYLLDPTFSPEVSGVPQKYPGKKVKKGKKKVPEKGADPA